LSVISAESTESHSDAWGEMVRRNIMIVCLSSYGRLLLQCEAALWQRGIS